MDGWSLLSGLSTGTKPKAKCFQHDQDFESNHYELFAIVPLNTPITRHTFLHVALQPLWPCSPSLHVPHQLCFLMPVCPLGRLTAGHLASRTPVGNRLRLSSTSRPKVIVSFHALRFSGQESFHRVMTCVIPFNFLITGGCMGPCLTLGRVHLGVILLLQLQSDSY